MIDVRKFFRSIPFALNGISSTAKTENNFKIHLVATIGVIVLGIVKNLSKSDWLWIFSAIALVVLTELLNTAIESIVDLVSPSHHPLAGKAKDAAAGAVLVASIYAVIVGYFVFLGPFIN